MNTLEVENLRTYYHTNGETVRAVDGVSFNLDPDTILGLVGESGCGKSTLVKSIIRDLPDNAKIESGSVRYGDNNISEIPEKDFRSLRWDEISYVPQGAMGILDPVHSIREQLVETINAHRAGVSKNECIEKCEEVLDLVGIATERLDDYPHQLSGGMRQRILLAMAIILDPAIIIADEPTTGLDVLIRDKILHDIETYQENHGVSVLFVSHDIADIVETTDYLMVMYGGKIVEKGPSEDVLENPTHPYTIGLKHSLPDLHSDPTTLIDMGMEPPNLINPPSGCRFVRQCPYAIPECYEDHPPLNEANTGCISACYRAEDAETMRSNATEVNWRNE